MNTNELVNNFPHYLQKIKTNIIGFDEILFKGLDLINKRTVIAIQGGMETDKTLFGLQMLYGLGQSLSINIKDCELKKKPFIQYLSNYQSKGFIEDLLLDTIIASGIRRMTELSVSTKDWSLISNGFSSEFFDMTKICCQDTCKEFYEKLPLTDIKERTDDLICEEVIYYSNRTNSLHFRAPSSQSNDVNETLDGDIITNRNNILFTRKHDSISQYVYNVQESTGSESDGMNEKFNLLGTALNYPFVGVSINDFRELNLCQLCGYMLTAIDISEGYKGLNQIIQSFKESEATASDHKVLILIAPNSLNMPEEYIDMYIEMGSELVYTHQVNYLSIKKSKTQNSVSGCHQYMRRDYGIEVYPNMYYYFIQRRYLPRALVYTHSDVITDTYQQYLDRNWFMGERNIRFQNFAIDKHKMKEDYLKALYPKYNTGDDFTDILERIFLTDEQYLREHRSPNCKPNDVNDLIYGFRGGVTAIIGNSNSYKRFFTFGCAFSSSVNKEHTLFLLLNLEDNMIRRRLSCPARRKKGKECEDCTKCYSYMHFMNIAMGNITPDELIFYLKRQLEIGFREDGKKISRVIVDSLEIVDFSSPLLRKSELFLSALAAVCRDMKISLYVLCDKHAGLVNELRTVADNTICMERDEKGRLLVYIDKYAGYNNTPSKIYSGKIDSAKDLFLCFEEMNNKEQYTQSFIFNTKSIEDHMVYSMERFWNGNNND